MRTTRFVTAIAMLLVFSAGATQQRWDTNSLLQLGKDEGKLPGWLDWGDKFKATVNGGKVYACLTDTQSGSRWVTWASWSKVRRYFDGYPWLSAGDGVPTTEADWNNCFPDVPFPVPLTFSTLRWTAVTKLADGRPLPAEQLTAYIIERKTATVPFGAYATVAGNVTELKIPLPLPAGVCYRVKAQRYGTAPIYSAASPGVCPTIPAPTEVIYLSD